MRKLVFTFLLIFSTLALGEGRMPLNDVRLQGSQRYTRDEVLSAIGLKIGTQITPDDMAAAVERLSNTGAFGRVSYQYQYGPKGYLVTFRAEDADGYYPVKFVNFFWFDETELMKTLLARVPLFKGVMPNTAPMADNAAAVLQELVNARGISGKVTAVPEAKARGEEMHVWKFKLTGLKIKINSVVFPGAGEAESTLQSRVRDMLTEDYEDGLVASHVETNLLPALHNFGLLQARFGEPQVKLASTDPNTPAVTITLPVQLGPQFRVGSLRIDGNVSVPLADLEKRLNIKCGEIADASKVFMVAAGMRTVYGTKGFIKANVEELPAINPAERTVNYTFRIEEGEQYKMGKVEFANLDKKGVEKLSKLWKLNEGDIYNTEYVDQFGAQLYGMVPRDVQIRTALNVDHAAKIVNVVYRFMK